MGFNEGVYFRARAEVQREEWRNGTLPTRYERALPFLYAKSFLTSLDSITKMLGTLAKFEAVPQGVEKARAQFKTHFPTLKDVRDTIQHGEDRSLGLDGTASPST
jgi:hypothetical protein